MKKINLLIAVLISISTGMALAQARQITGTVLDETGVGLAGAGIGIRGTSSGTVTDVDGKFQLDLPEGNNTIVVQATGYRTQTLTVTGNSITVNMASDNKELEGAVVTALALKREKRSLGYGTTTLNSDDLNSSNSFSALSAIQGKTAGVNITSSTGGPGGSTRIVMRGEKSLRNNNQALIVVDGVPISNGQRTLGRDERYQVDFGNRGNDIDPDDIESMTVLKGAVAAALYGEQASGGAVMITTKSGKGRSMKKNNGFSFSTSYTLSDILMYPEFQNTYGQGDLHGNPTDRRENFSWGRKFDGQLRPWGQVINGQQLIKPYSAQPDNVKSFFNTGRTWENNFQMGGSNDKGNYLLSINTMNNDGVVPNTFFDKYGIRFNGSMDLPNKMYSSVSVNYINTYQRIESSGQGNESIYNNLIQTPRDIPIWELKDYSNPFYSMQTIDSAGVERYGYYGAYTQNPYWINDKTDNRMRSDRVIAGLTVGARPNSHWDVFNRLGLDFTSDRAQLKVPKYNSKPFDEAFYFSGGATQDQNSQGGYTEDNINAFLLNNDLIAVYNTTLAKKIGFNGTIGNNLQVSRTTRTRPRIDDQENGLVVPDYYNLSNGQGPIDPGTYPDVIGYSELRRVSLYGQAAFDYNKFLFLEVTGRNDWTSTLSENQRSFFYPSVSLSWVFSEHLKTNDILSYGKIRTSYAVTGTGADFYANNAPAFIRAEAGTGFGTVRFPFQGTPAFTYQNSYGIPELEPEKTKTFEIGTELAFLRNRVNIDLTYYNSRTEKMIVPVPLPPGSGFTQRVINIGEVKNDGVELALRVTPVSTLSGFRWEVFGTYTKNVNKVVSIAPGVDQISLGGISGAAAYAQVGQPFGAFYATDVATTPDGRVIVDSATGMPQIGANPVYKGSYQPRFIASWGTNLRYKGFTLALLFDTKQGGVFFSRTKDLMDFVGTAKETEMRDPYVYPNSVYVNAEGDYITNTTQFDPYNWYTSVIPSGRHIIDASYVKWREASLSYRIPDRWLKRTSFGNAEVSIYGNNLFIWTAKENMYSDPEMNSGGASNLQGFEYSARMSLRNYGIRLNLTF